MSDRDLGEKHGQRRTKTREQQQHSVTLPQGSGLTADEQIDMALGRAYAILIQAAKRAHASQQQDQGTCESEPH